MRPRICGYEKARRLELSLARQTDYGLSARRPDRVLALSRSARHYRPRVRDGGPLIEAMQAHLKDNPGYGFGLLFGEGLNGARPAAGGSTRS